MSMRCIEEISLGIKVHIIIFSLFLNIFTFGTLSHLIDEKNKIQTFELQEISLSKVGKALTLSSSNDLNVVI